MFQTPSTPTARPQVKEDVGVSTRTFQVPVVKQEAPAPPAPPPAQAKNEPGEFTRMFQAPAAPASEPVVPTPPAQPSGPGEFTRMFQTPAPLLRPRKPLLLSLLRFPSRVPGEFTRMFQAPPTPPERPFITPDRTPRTPEPPNVHACEFTRMFETATAPAAPTPSMPAPPAAKPAGAWRIHPIFSDPQQSSTPAAHPAYKDPFAKAQEPTAPESGVGEFTRMFGTPAVSANPLPHTSIPPAPAAIPKPRHPNSRDLASLLECSPRLRSRWKLRSPRANRPPRAPRRVQRRNPVTCRCSSLLVSCWPSRS